MKDLFAQKYVAAGVSLGLTLDLQTVKETVEIRKGKSPKGLWVEVSYGGGAMLLSWDGTHEDLGDIVIGAAEQLVEDQLD